jgi:hypothetical protein
MLTFAGFSSACDPRIIETHAHGGGLCPIRSCGRRRKSENSRALFGANATRRPSIHRYDPTGKSAPGYAVLKVQPFVQKFFAFAVEAEQVFDR